MSTIIYSMCGEGRGHATRVQTIVETMLPRHRFILLAARDAYAQLCERYYEHPLVTVRRLPGLFFSYRGTKVDYARSIGKSLPFLWNLRSLVDYVGHMIDRDRPDLAITDFEPILPRAAKSRNIPWISLDHQHILSTSDLRGLPSKLRWRSRFLRSSIALFYRGQAGEAISSFHHLPPRNGTEHYARIGVLLRSNVLHARELQLSNRGHILVYLRKHAHESLWKALQLSGRRVIVYGLGTLPQRDNIEFRELADDPFVFDLATADCLVSTAGNQLIGEAFYLRKPVLAIPEEGNFEQQLNAWMVSQSGGGWSTTFVELTPHFLKQFLLAVPLLARAIQPESVRGNEDAINFILRHLPADDYSGPATPFDFGDYVQQELSHFG